MRAILWRSLGCVLLLPGLVLSALGVGLIILSGLCESAIARESVEEPDKARPRLVI